MKQKLYLSIQMVLVATVVGCASSPSKDSSAVEVAERAESKPSAPAEITPTEPIPAADASFARVPIAAPVALADSDQKRLSQAIQSSNWPELVRVSEMILVKSPQDAKALNALGLAYYRQGKPKAAQYFLSQALKNPGLSKEERAMIVNNLAVVQLQGKDSDLALKKFRQAFQFNGSDAVVAANMGAIYLKNQDQTKGLIAMEIAKSRFPKDAKVLTNYGAALAAKGKFKDAEDAYKEALKANSQQKEALFNLAVLYVLRTNRLAEGRDVIQKLKFLGLPPDLREATNDLEKRVKSALK